MKVIDLLVKIANGEEVPKIILFNSYKYKFDKTNNEYQRLNYNGTLGATLGTINALDLYLNDEIEIIDEDKKIEKLAITYLEKDDRNDIIDKINEIIDKINSGSDKE